MKKIIFDLENTLISGKRNDDWKYVMEPRPGAMKLLEQLRELKMSHNVEFVLLSSSTDKWVQVGIQILGARDLFNEIYTAENPLKIKPTSIEEEHFGVQGLYYGQKPFSSISGDIFLVEDSPIMENAATSIVKKYKLVGDERKIKFCKVDYFEAIDPRRIKLIELLELKKDKTEFEKEQLIEMKLFLEIEKEKNYKQLSNVYEMIFRFVMDMEVE